MYITIKPIRWNMIGTAVNANCVTKQGTSNTIGMFVNAESAVKHEMICMFGNTIVVIAQQRDRGHTSTLITVLPIPKETMFITSIVAADAEKQKQNQVGQNEKISGRQA